MMDDRANDYRPTSDTTPTARVTKNSDAPTAGRSSRTILIVGRNTEGDEVMKLKLVVTALALVIATPTFAAEYYIVQSASNKKCSIASKKPTSDKMTLVGDGTAYKTKKEARTALKAADACKA
jgi:hypothetical protein